MKTHQYDASFFNYINDGSLRSSKEIIPFLLELIDVDSVLDIGCGTGAWLKTWKEMGVSDIIGVDGGYANNQNLLLERTNFVEKNVSEPFNLKRKFSLVQCLEVAEHIDPSLADNLIQNLCRHSDVILFSAATPGQGGECHVNEQPYEYWREKFRRLGFDVYDPLRKKFKDNKNIEPWYKYNSFLYINNNIGSDVNLDTVNLFKVSDNKKLTDISPIIYRFRKFIISLLPVTFSTWCAYMKKHIFLTIKRFKHKKIM